MAGSCHPVACRKNHLSAAFHHIAAHVVQVRSARIAGASHYDIVGGIDAVAAGSVRCKEVVPAVAVHKGRCLAVDGDVSSDVACLASTRSGVEFAYADCAEICSVRAPQSSVRAHKESRVDGPAVLVGLCPGYELRLGIAEVGRLRIQGLGPHSDDVSAGLSGCSGEVGAVRNQIAVANLDYVRGYAAACADAASGPGVSVL